MQINKTAVVGAGTMGSSIVVALIGRGFPVVLKETDRPSLARGLEKIHHLMAGKIKKGLTQEQADRELALIQPCTDYQLFPEVDLVIEAVGEEIALKRKIFQDLDDSTNLQTILASNTSSLPITLLGSFTKRPDKVVGLHFFNPAHRMRLVEVVPGLESSNDTVRSAVEFGRALGKLAVPVAECPSFLVNRLLGRYMNEALWCLMENQSEIETIDQTVCDYLMPIGPFALRDMNGADIGLQVARFNYQEYGERFRPAPILEEMVQRGLLGTKSGSGFYLYDSRTRKRTGVNPRVSGLVNRLSAANLTRPSEAASQRAGFDVERLFLPMINEAFLALQEQVCAPEDLDPALMAGLGMSKGPLSLASEIGLSHCLQKTQALFDSHGERFRPAPWLKRYVWAGRTVVP